MRDLSYDEHVEIETQKFYHRQQARRCSELTSWVVSLLATLFIFSIIGVFMFAVFVSLK